MGRHNTTPDDAGVTQTTPGAEPKPPEPQGRAAPLALANTVAAPARPLEQRPSPNEQNTLTARGAVASPGGVARLEELVAPSHPVEPEALPPSIDGRYRPMELLGKGGMGAVYRARDVELNRDVALKFLNAGDAELGHRLLQEARAQAKIDHENVCKVYEVGVAEGRRYIAMQLIDGASLDQARDTLTLEEKVQVVARIALALHEAHRLALIHRDVKPSNIMVERAQDGGLKPYIMDFGIAKDVGAQGVTATTALAGTPAYMAPEQARGDLRALGRRSDVYSLGATLYDVLAGRPPFVEPNLWTLFQRLQTEDPAPIRTINPHVPEDVEAILMKCLEREPSRRYESARALSEDLQRFLDGEPVSARRRSWWYLVYRRAKKHKALVAASVVALGVVTSFSAYSIHTQRKAEQTAQLARELGESVKEMELFLRSAHQLPLHDIERERDIVRRRLAGIAAHMAAAGPMGQGPGHYALGRGHLALREPQVALEHLEQASAAGYASPELEYAQGLALGELFTEALEQARRIEEPEQKKARLAAIDAQYKEPALRHLHAALGARLEAPQYVEGLIALYEGHPESAVTKAREAFGQMPWLYEAKQLEGDAELALAKRWGYDAELDPVQMNEHFDKAAAAYRTAAEIAASDPQAHLGECELWTQRMNAAYREKEVLLAAYAKSRAACDKAVVASSKSHVAHFKGAYALGNFAWLVAAATARLEEKEAKTVLQAAIDQAEEAKRRQPNDPMTAYLVGLAWRATAFYRWERGLPNRAGWDRAIAEYEAALRWDPMFLWALNDLCFAYGMKAASDVFVGIDPLASQQRAVALCDKAAQIQPKALYPHIYKFRAHFFGADYLLDSGQDPAPQMSQARATIEVAKKISPAWPWADRQLSFADWGQARHELASGKDPTPTLNRILRTTEAQKDNPELASTAYEILGPMYLTQALYLLQQGEDPTPAIRPAREAFQRGLEQASWDIGYRVSLAGVEVVALRWALREKKATQAHIDAALAPLAPLLNEDRADPRFYQTLADMDALSAAWRLSERKSPAADIARGLDWVARALAIHPKMATAFAARAALHLVEARAAKDAEARTQAARRADEAAAAALRENPLLERELSPIRAELASLLRSP